MNKKQMAIGTMSAVLFLAGCGTVNGPAKSDTQWCQGFGDTVFSLNYSSENSYYDGIVRTFTAKEESELTSALTHDQNYWKTVSYADGEEETWLFIQNGQGFYCGKTESGYLLTLSAVSLGEEMFAFPPMKNTDVGDSIEINYTWEEFSDFFRSIDGATVSDGFVTTTLYGGIGAEAIGIASLTYRDGTVQVSVSQNS